MVASSDHFPGHFPDHFPDHFPGEGTGTAGSDLILLVGEENDEFVVKSDVETFFVDLALVGAKLGILYKDPDAKKIITIDWSRWLKTSEIASVAWEADSGITLSDASNTTTTATNYISEGTENGEYDVKCTITTNDSVARIEPRS